MIVMIMLMKSIHEHKTSWEIEDGDEQESHVIRMVSELSNAPEKRRVFLRKVHETKDSNENELSEDEE